MGLRTRIWRRGLGLVVLCTGLAGCTQFEPFQREGTWHQNDAPMHNIAAELANPHDLYIGRGDRALTGSFATSAIGTIADSGASGGSAGSSGTAPSGSVGGAGGTNSGSTGGVGGSTGGLGGSTGGSSATGLSGGSM